MKIVSTEGLTRLIQLIKSNFISNDDTVDTTEVSIDAVPTENSENLITSGGVYNSVKDKQDTLVSGTNIKTINNESILGEGNITINADIESVGSDIIPSITATYNIGSEDKRFKAIYVDEAYLSTNTLYLGDTPVLGTSSDTVNIKADEDQSILVKTTGEGSTQLVSDKSVDITSKLDNSSVNITARGNNGAVNISGTKDINLTATNISLTGTATISNLNVTGTTTTVYSQDLSVKDNLIEINAGETGSGVSAGQAGLKVNRGDLPDYRIMFDEADDMFKVGMNGDLETIASQDYVNDQIKNSTITIKQGDTTKGTFTLNQSSDSTIELDVATSGTWGNISGSLEDQTDLKNALDNKQNALTDGDKQAIADLHADPFVPTKTSELTNDSDFITTDYHDTTKQDNLSVTQLSATNSGITATKVTKFEGYETLINNKQDTLISGTTIKTINNVDILGEGDISLEGFRDFKGNWNREATYFPGDVVQDSNRRMSICIRENTNRDPNSSYNTSYWSMISVDTIDVKYTAYYEGAGEDEYRQFVLADKGFGSPLYASDEFTFGMHRKTGKAKFEKGIEGYYNSEEIDNKIGDVETALAVIIGE